jgi:hypothetical protein
MDEKGLRGPPPRVKVSVEVKPPAVSVMSKVAGRGDANNRFQAYSLSPGRDYWVWNDKDTKWMSRKAKKARFR